MAQRSAVDVAKGQIVAYNEKNWDAARALLATDCVYDEVPTQRRPEGPDQILEAWKGWAAAFPDSKGSIDHVVDKDGEVVIEVTWRGTHSGTLAAGRSLAPTGRRIEIRACQVVTVRGERVAGLRHYFDMATLMQQLGVS